MIVYNKCVKTERGEEPLKRIVIGILAHVDAGKTTLSEALLYNAGVIRSVGRVDTKNTTMDSSLLEKERGITIYSSISHFTFGDTSFSIIDTPGHTELSSETERAISVIDCACLVISGSEGVQSHTETLWKALRKYGIPTFIFVSKCDMERRTRESLLEEIKSRFGPCEEIIPGKYENIATFSDALLEEYLDTGTLSDDGIRNAVKCGNLFPVSFGSGLKNEGVTDYLSLIDKYSSGCEDSTVLSGIVYKITHEKGERIAHLKISSGSLKVKDEVSAGGNKYKINQIRRYSGEKYVNITEAFCGEICAVTGLKDAVVGTVIGEKAEDRIEYSMPVMIYDIVLPKNVKGESIREEMALMNRENPSYGITWNERYSLYTVSLAGKVQTEIFIREVKDKFDLDITLEKGRVIYKETVSGIYEGIGHYEPLRHYSEVHLLIEGMPFGSGLIVQSDCPVNDLDANWQGQILSALREKKHLGILTGSPLTDVKITLKSGRAHIKHTEGGDFRQAACRALRQGLMEARNILLEPYCSFRISLPVSCIGRAISDIKLMGGQSDAPSSDGDNAILTGKVPVASSLEYQMELLSYTSGKGRITFTPCGYDVCHNTDEVVASFEYNPESDLENTPDSVFCAHGAGFTVKWNDVRNYMHLESVLKKKEETKKKKYISIDEKELEEIMLREFGPIKRPVYTAPKPEKGNEIKKTIAETTRLLIVDGYNVINSWEEMKLMWAAGEMEQARQRLISILTNYSAFTGVETVLVFDAYNTPSSASKTIEGVIKVVFTAQNETADAYIEKLVHDIGKNYSVRVVTNDGLIRLSALRAGTMLLTSSEFEEEILRIDGEIGKIINREG